MADFEIEEDAKRLISSASCSKSINETVDGTHEFVIKGYSLAKGIGPGKYISSDTFTVGGYDWAIYFYPDGKNPEDNNVYVSVFIALASDGNDVRALFELTLLDQSDNRKHKVHSHFERALEGGPYTLKYRGSMWGYKRFFRRAILETSDYLKDDTLCLRCKVGVVRNRVECPKQLTIKVPPPDMGDGFKSLLDDELGCDVEFQVGDETFRAHKLFLAARSPVFRAQFFGLIGDPSSKKVVLHDIEPAIFKGMLVYIYTDNLPNVHGIMGSPSSSSFTIMVQHLLAAADQFGLDRLKLLCEAKLCEEITVETVGTTLSLAEQHRCAQLKSICLKFAAQNLEVVMESEGYKYLEQTCPALLAELLQTVATVDETSGMSLSRKRSGSSIFGLDIDADGPLLESTNPNGRRARRRF